MVLQNIAVKDAVARLDHTLCMSPFINIAEIATFEKISEYKRKLLLFWKQEFINTKECLCSYQSFINARKVMKTLTAYHIRKLLTEYCISQLC